MSVLVPRISDRLRSGQYQHAVMWLGSIVSSRGPSACPTVTQIRDNLVIEPLRDLVSAGRLVGRCDGPIRRDLVSLLERMRSLDRRGIAWGTDALTDNIARMPFERFMSCLAESEDNASAAKGVIASACRVADDYLEANELQVLVARLATCLLDTFQLKLTIVTTNYDMLLEAAFSSGRCAASVADSCT